MDVVDELRERAYGPEESLCTSAADEIERLRRALETAAARFNMMAGVGLVNGTDPKVGYREAMAALTSHQ